MENGNQFSGSAVLFHCVYHWGITYQFEFKIIPIGCLLIPINKYWHQIVVVQARGSPVNVCARIQINVNGKARKNTMHVQLMPSKYDYQNMTVFIPTTICINHNKHEKRNSQSVIDQFKSTQITTSSKIKPKQTLCIQSRPTTSDANDQRPTTTIWLFSGQTSTKQVPGINWPRPTRVAGGEAEVERQEVGKSQ